MKPEYKYDSKKSLIALVTVGRSAYLYIPDRYNGCEARCEITTSTVQSYDEATGRIETLNSVYVPV